jgi:hypothetical protein
VSNRKLPYKEGDWFLIPLDQGGHATGLVARAPKGGKILYGYFFGPRRETVSTIQELENLQPSDAILIARFGDLRLMTREWPVISHSDTWNRQKWPMISFVRIDSISGAAYRIDYADDGSNKEIRSTPCSSLDAKSLPRDRLAGPQVLESNLSDLLPLVTKTIH